MSYLLKNALFAKKELENIKINLDVPEGGIKTILYDDHKTLKNLTNILNGKYNVINGEFKIDSFDKVDKNWTRRICNIFSKKKLVSTIVPAKLIMFLSLYFNKNFYKQAKTEYVNNKYNYISFLKSNNNKLDLNMRKTVEDIVETFIKSSLDFEIQWLEEFRQQIIKFNEEKLNSNFGDLENQTKILIKDYYLLSEKTKNQEILETFLQSLWDKVYSFLDIRSSCHCEYNSNKSKNKKVKSLRKELDFHQIEWLIRKQLKIIDIEVNSLKRSLYNKRLIMKNLEKQIKKQFEKSKYFNKKVTKDLSELFSWRQLVDDQRFEFVKKQEKMIFTNLLDESQIIRGKIVEIIHDYHLKILNNQFEIGDNLEFKVAKINEKNKIISIWKQAKTWTRKTLDTLNISIDFNKKNFKLTKLNMIYLRLLQTLYSKKKNIIFTNISQIITKKDSIEFCQTLKKIQENFPKLTIIFLEPNLKGVFDLGNEYSSMTTNDFKNVLLSSQIKISPDLYIDNIFKFSNVIDYNITKNIYVCGQLVDWNFSYELNKNGKLFINPFMIFTDKKNSPRNSLELEIKLKKVKNFYDSNIYTGISNQGDSILFYSTNKILHPIIKIYIPQEAIIKII